MSKKSDTPEKELDREPEQDHENHVENERRRRAKTESAYSNPAEQDYAEETVEEDPGEHEHE